MDNSIGQSIASGGKTKDDLIHQAHEARQARELSRRRDEATVTIQAFLKSAHVRRKLKEDTIRELEMVVKKSAFPVGMDALYFSRKLLFICDSHKDRATLDSFLQFILTISSDQKRCSNDEPPPNDDQDKCPDSTVVETRQSLIDDAIKESIELSSDHIVCVEKEKSDPSVVVSEQMRTNFVRLVAEDASKGESSLQGWLRLIERILNLCLDYLKDVKSTRLDSQHIDTYLQTINLFTSSKSLGELCEDSPPITPPGVCPDILHKISSELLTKTLYNRRSIFFRCMTTLICEKINRSRNDLRSSILTSYTRIALRLLRLDNPQIQSPDSEDLNRPKVKDLVDSLTRMLCIPGFIHNLEKHSPEALKELNENSIFQLSVRLLVSEQDFQKLTSSSSVCLLANMVHLASLNEDVLALDTMKFVVLATKLLESCQKNMLHISSTIISGNPRLPIATNNNSNKKKSESMAVSFNPLLGWLAREQAINIDKDMIKSQLCHLWSVRFLKILLHDLIMTNEKSQLAQTSNNLSGLRHNYCDTSSSAPVGLFRRAVERATTAMTKTINNSYAKSTGASNNSGSSKLTTPEANRIALVCFMLHTTLKTLTTLKQDILTGLCLHDYILPNLWTFISSLGANNGLRAFLDHLTMYTKTSAPEFHILTLFCECASHLISILDDSELYERQQPFRLEDLVAISYFLNNFVFRIIYNNLIPPNSQDQDPILQTTHKLLTDLYRRDCRRKFAPQDHWLIKDIKMSMFLKDLEAGKPVAKTIMTMLPHIIPHKERVLIFRKLVSKDKSQYRTGPSTLITIHRSRIVEDGYQQLVRLSPHALKGLIRVKFINDYGLDEAGIDQDGVFKEFLEDTIKRVFDPALNLFCSTSEQRLYPSPTSRLHEDYLSLFKFVGKMLAKAIYEGIVVDVPFASFFLSRVLGQPQSPLYSPIDELPSLDPELYKSLTYIKHYEGDVSELDLTFSIDQDFMGKIETYELEAGGRSIPVTRESRVRYIHSVANFRMKTQIEKQTEAFVSGFKSIINVEWLTMFSASEFQRLISGDNTPIDLQDLRRHTKYFGGFHNNHRVVCWLWDILEKDFSSEEHKLFLKFVTSCSKPPLLGFSNLEPPFSIRCVEVSDDQDLGDTVGSMLRGFFAIRRSDPVDRLPSSSTCFNLLKLPNYQRRSTLREKLRYAIRSNPGFELS